MSVCLYNLWKFLIHWSKLSRFVFSQKKLSRSCNSWKYWPNLQVGTRNWGMCRDSSVPDCFSVDLSQLDDLTKFSSLTLAQVLRVEHEMSTGEQFPVWKLLTTGIPSGCKALAHWWDQLWSFSHITSKFHQRLDVKIAQSDTILVRLEVKWVQGWQYWSTLPSLDSRDSNSVTHAGNKLLGLHA